MKSSIDWRTVTASVVASGALLLLFTAVVVFIVLPNYVLQMGMAQQALSIELPATLPVQVQLAEPINARMDSAIQLSVPIDQKLPMRIDERLFLDVHFDADIPLDFEVVIDNDVAVDSMMQTTVFGVPMTLPIKGKLPVHMIVPISQTMPLKFSAPISVDLKKAFEIELKTTLDTAVEIHEDLSIPVLEALDTEIRMRPDTPINVQVGAERLAVPLGSVRVVPAETAKSQSSVSSAAP